MGKGAVVRYDEELARRAAAFKEAEAATGAGKFMSFRAGQMSFQGSPVEGNKLDVAVLDGIFENAYYPEDFDSENPTPPVCYAFSRDGKNMAPHEKASKPQHATCAGCPQNEFGTAERGRGKACKNIRRIAIIPAKPLTVESIKKAEVAFAKIPVTSVVAYAIHVKQIADLLKKPPYGAVTTLGCQPDTKKQVAVTFAVASEIKDGKLLGALMAKADEVQATIASAYPDPDEMGGGEKKVRKAGAGKKKKKF